MNQSRARATVDEERPRPRAPAQVAKDVLLLFAAPFITLAYLPLFPFIGLMMMTRRGERMWHRWSQPE
ncbi:MAG TPA: hypothetical protein VMB34_32330 [Acetobacteraceae bacterium]|nr:hypothetical protein [Acetobacteraceae bacterium]